MNAGPHAVKAIGVALFAAGDVAAEIGAKLDAANLLEVVVDAAAAANRGNILTVDTHLLHIHSAINAQLGTGGDGKDTNSKGEQQRQATEIHAGTSVSTMGTGMSTHLERILANTRVEVSARKAAAAFAALEEAAAAHTPRGFARALRERAKTGPAVIAELKKASPSKGLIRAEFEPVALGTELEAAGAACLSVLTDEVFFQGGLENLRRVSAAVKIPCLRKDFMVEPFQVLEARAAGADAILLIMAALGDEDLRILRDTARTYGLDVLCEVHDQGELDRALQLDCECVGVNSRNLKTFDVSIERAVELASQLPDGVVRVAESGIASRQDVENLRVAGFDAFLIGETLMRQPSPGAMLRELIG